MENLKIASFNVKDGKVNSQGGIRPDGTDNALLVSNIIKDFDLIGTQELTFKYLSRVGFELGKQYRICGNYRYGKTLKNMPFNETNSIITNQTITSSKTVWLPWVADNLGDLKTSITKLSIMPRIATIVIFETEDKKQNCMINTHLDYQIPSIQARQLEALKGIIFKYGKDYPIILTGDFNMTPQDEKFISFGEEVKGLIKRVEIDKPTWNGEKTVDHIFVPKTWDIVDAGVVSSQQTSDHNVVYTKVRTR